MATRVDLSKSNDEFSLLYGELVPGREPSGTCKYSKGAQCSYLVSEETDETDDGEDSLPAFLAMAGPTFELPSPGARLTFWYSWRTEGPSSTMLIVS